MLVIPLLYWADALSFGAARGRVRAGRVRRAVLRGAEGDRARAARRGRALVGRANALFQGANRMTLLLGPVIGGVLIAVLSAPAVLVVDAATYVVAVALVAARSSRTAPMPTRTRAGGRCGLRFIVREPLLRVWWPSFAVGDAAWAAFFVAVPVLVVTALRRRPARRRLAARVVRGRRGARERGRVPVAARQRCDGLTVSRRA